VVASQSIDAFISWYMRRQVRRILTFAPAASGAQVRPPAPAAGSSYLLYLHVPFCEELCPYCSFNRVRLEAGLAARYFEGLRAEMRAYARLGYRFDAAYVGGGTPTVLPAELGSVLRLARELWPIRSLSVETNPNHLTPEILGLLADCGVDRLSVGVQSFDDGLLDSVHRLHRYGTGAQVRDRLAAARGRFATLNADMLFNLAGQTEAMLERDLATLRELAPEQVTFYPLMSPRAQRGPYSRERRYYALIRAGLGEAYLPSTAWCFSQAEKAGLIDEYIVAREEYAGLGSGSFGYLGGELYSNTFSLKEYIRRTGRGELPVAAARPFTAGERLRYDFLMKLFGGRLDLDALEVRHGAGAAGRLWKELAFFRAIGVLRHEGRTVRLTDAGNYVWVMLMREFFTGVNRLRAARLAAGE
jgi:coproporphyrinogen III oxidase-like Fe-S oxidoreductase